MGNPYKARKRVEVTEEKPVEEETPVVEETSEVPEGTITEILDWVGDDEDRAVEALTAEEAGERRKTLIKKLEEIIEGV